MFISNYRPFAPAVPETFDWDRAPVNTNLAPPVVSVQRIDRAPLAPADPFLRTDSCIQGQVMLSVQLQNGTAADLAQTGFRFVQSDDAFMFIEPEPHRGKIEGNAMLFDFSIFENPTQASQARETLLTVYAVNARQERGPAVSIRIHASPRQEDEALALTSSAR
ncbi:hypothetical protein [Pseudoduganella chitinolytica]|uniref:Uncharacterized protein n=1 Tax=Pseudoduganella chitinolytica TaxID=34070 RepID=A0ABY8BGH8_9BURK|nr:hypothetical protein [Pseudoduganella chitinolytica]WEF34078.1 hypothetical protein PX653_04705 [Pseudoduganella chitinolytica]